MFKSFLILCLFAVGIELIHCLPKDTFEKPENRIDRYCEVSKCHNYQYTWGSTFMKEFNFDEMASNVEPLGYIARLTLFVKAPETARIRLGEEADIDQAGGYYDIVLGAENNTKSWLEVSGSSEPLQALQTPNIVTEDVPHKIKIEIPEGGLIKVFIDHYTRPLFEAPHIHPIRVKYISFAADDTGHAEYFFDCDENQLEGPTAGLNGTILFAGASTVLASNTLFSIAIFSLVALSMYSQ